MSCATRKIWKENWNWPSHYRCVGSRIVRQIGLSKYVYYAHSRWTVKYMDGIGLVLDTDIGMPGR